MTLHKIYILFLALLLTGISGDLFAQKKLLTESSSAASDQQVNEKVLRKQKEKSKNGAVKIFDFSKDALEDNSIEIEIIKGEPVVYFKDEVEIIGPENVVWYGHSITGSTATLVYLNGDLSGTIIIGNKKYALSPLGKGKCSVYEVDDTKFPDDHSKDDKSLKPSKRDESTGSALEDAGGNCSVRILVAYTAAAQTGAAGIGYSDFKLFAQQCIANTNQTYINSQVAHRVSLAATIKVSYTESGSFATDVNRLQATADGYMDNVHTYRNIYTADMCALIIDNSSACGRAYDIGVTATGAFVTAHYDCCLGNYSFAHELGHLYGCRHNPEEDGTLTPFAYGHGYNNIPAGWRTVMAYNVAATPTTRLPYFSNPNITYGGLAMGDATRRDNARVLNERDITMAGFRSPSSTLTINSTGNLLSGETGDAVANTQIVLAAGFKASSGSIFKASVGTCVTTFRWAAANSGSAENAAIEADRINVFPNPGNGLININLNYPETREVKISVVNSVGLKVFDKNMGNITSSVESIDLSNQTAGIYLITVEADGEIETRQVGITR
jgi:peptidyl-Asp metalloendopeptidase